MARRTRGRTFYSLLLSTVVAFLCVFQAFRAQAVAGDVYDQPIEVRRVPLKADPHNPQAKRNVTCFTYSHFVVKQVDLGEVGADRLSIIPAAPGKTPRCRQAKEPDEYVIPGDSWSGYFEGARSDYAFFVAADGTDGGLGFMVFDTAGRKKLFEDTAEKGIESIEVKDRTLRLRYQRVFASECSVVTDGAACQNIIAEKTGVSRESLSSCAGGYESAKEAMAKSRCELEAPGDSSCIQRQLKLLNEQKWDSAPTVIVYEAEAVPGGQSPVIKPLSPVLACRPSD